METKVQCKSYLPTNYSMMNLKEANGSWYYEDKTLNGHLYNDFILQPVNGYTCFDKEFLRRTMLEHEAIFRKQVYELHRLYRIQKNLMDELKMKQLYSSVPSDTSQPIFLSPKTSSEATEKTGQMPCLAIGEACYNRASMASINETRPPLEFLKEHTMQSSPPSSLNGPPPKLGELLNSNRIKVPRELFQFQHPSSVYIDNGDAEGEESEKVSKIGVVETEDDAKLSLSLGEHLSFRKGSWNSDLDPQYDLSILKMADLNEPAKGICYERETAATQFISMKIPHDGMEGHKLPTNTSHVHKGFFKELCRDEVTRSNVSNADKKETRQEMALLHNEIGQIRMDARFFSPSYHVEEHRPLPKPTQSASNGVGVTGSSLYCAKPVGFVGTVPQTGRPFPIVPYPDCHSTTATTSSWRKPSKKIAHIPIAVQALPCFNGAASMNMQRKNCHTGGHDLRSIRSSSVHLQLPSITFTISNLYGRDSGGYQNDPVPSGIKREQEKGKGTSSLWPPQGFPSSFPAEDSRRQHNEASGSMNGKRILEFPISDEFQQDGTCPPSITETLCNEKGLRNHIDLNSACMENSPEDEAKVASEIDAEAPLATQLEGNPVFPLVVCSPEAIITDAAENLIALNRAVESTHPLIPPSCDSLQWLAEIASSNATSWKASKESSDDDISDSVEPMTLRFDGMKPGEYRSRPEKPKSQKDGKIVNALLLQSRPRRDQTRRRQQPRDSESDILPGLMSLPRNKVNRVLHTLRGTTNRSPVFQSKGTRRPRSLTITVAETCACPTGAQSTQPGLELDGKTTMGWGRRTKRCRVPRVPSGCASALLT